MKTCIDNLLPPHFTMLMGQYVQICAHIERVCWLILSNIQRTNWKDPSAVSALVQVRKNTPDLISSLRTEAAKLPSDLAHRLGWCLDQIELGIDRRHMAIHGAWSQGEQPNTFRVDYFMNTGTRKDPQWVAFFKTDFPFAELEGVVRDAEAILLKATDLNNAIIALNRPTASDAPAQITDTVKRLEAEKRDDDLRPPPNP